MNTFTRLVAAAAFGALQVAPLAAAFESLQFSPNNDLPRFPLELKLQGCTSGDVVVAISVDAQGKLADLLVLRYTKKPLAEACVQTLRSWHFLPARLDGGPVPALVELTFNFTLEGAVVSANRSDENYTTHFQRNFAEPDAYRVHSPSELDRAPVAINTPAPNVPASTGVEGVHGRVKVRFYIDEQGTVRLPAVAAGADPQLAEPAVAAVRGWKFEPPTSRGRPVLVSASQEFNFGD